MTVCIYNQRKGTRVLLLRAGLVRFGFGGLNMSLAPSGFFGLSGVYSPFGPSVNDYLYKL